MISFDDYIKRADIIQRRTDKIQYDPLFFPSIDEIDTYITPNLHREDYINYAIFLESKEVDAEDKEAQKYLSSLLKKIIT